MSVSLLVPPTPSRAFFLINSFLPFFLSLHIHCKHPKALSKWTKWQPVTNQKPEKCKYYAKTADKGILSELL